MPRRTLFPLLLLASCAAGEMRHREAGPASTPNATDISNAMAYSMPPPEEGGWICAIVSDIQCSPTSSTGRVQCTFKHQGRKRMAVLERTGRTEWERSGQWRLVRGWKSCGLLL
jgi:hypothetical protein